MYKIYVIRVYVQSNQTCTNYAQLLHSIHATIYYYIYLHDMIVLYIFIYDYIQVVTKNIDSQSPREGVKTVINFYFSYTSEKPA